LLPLPPTVRTEPPTGAGALPRTPGSSCVGLTSPVRTSLRGVARPGLLRGPGS
jgi:hypothetical protein